MATQIRAVIYDFGGVFSGSPFGAIRGYEHELGVAPGTVSEILFGRSYVHGQRDGDEHHPWHLLETGQLSMDVWADHVRNTSLERLGYELDLANAFSNSGGTSISWEMVHHVRRVKASDIATAILTNNVKEYGTWWRESIPVAEIIDVIVDSCEEGIRKPDPEIYIRTAQRLAVDPHECIFADDLEANVDAARRVGMTGVVVPEERAEAISEIESLL